VAIEPRISNYNGRYTQRRKLFKPKMNVFLSAVEGIQWIDFIGCFIVFITNNDVLKVMAINISNQSENNELYK
jgi:hypothetical protein